MRIPFNKPQIVGRELDYMSDAVRGGHTSAAGPFSERASGMLSDALDGGEVLLTTSCTDALEMTALSLDLGPGDTVIVPSFTFVSCAIAFARTGAKIRFADIEAKTLGIDPDSVHELMDDSVRAVVAVHYAGVACDIGGLQAVLAEWPNAVLVEDNAHGLLGTYRGRPLGTFGRFSTLSFHETKNIICGEGGALVLNDAQDRDRAWTIYHKGTDRRAFVEGRVDKYTWRDTGSSFGLSDLLAAYLTAQLEEGDAILKSRRAVHETYDALLRDNGGMAYATPTIPADRTSAYHMYYLLMADRAARDHLIRHLGSNGVHATFHYVPLHSAPAASSFSDWRSDCPVTDDVSARLVRLPFYNTLGRAEIEHVSSLVLESVGGV